MNAAQIIVAFPFNGDEVAYTILEYLYDVVDEFIIVEAWETFSGIPKKSLFVKKQSQRLQKFKSKITILEITAFPEKPRDWNPYNGMPETEKPAWFREFYQRDIVGEYLSSKQHPFVLCCIDADEIVDKTVLENVRTGKIAYDSLTTPHHLKMRYFHYNFHWEAPHVDWHLPFICNYHTLKMQQKLSRIRIDNSRNNPIILADAGWHCNCFMSVKDIIRKIESYSHRCLDDELVKTDQNIENCLRNGLDVFHLLETDLDKAVSVRGNTKLSRSSTGFMDCLPQPLKDLQTRVVAMQSFKKN